MKGRVLIVDDIDKVTPDLLKAAHAEDRTVVLLDGLEVTDNVLRAAARLRGMGTPTDVVREVMRKPPELPKIVIDDLLSFDAKCGPQRGRRRMFKRCRSLAYAKRVR